MDSIKSPLIGKNRWGYVVFAAVLALLLFPVLGLTLFLPRLMTVVPILLALLFAEAGPVSAVVCIAVLAGWTGFLFSAWGQGLWGVFCSLLFHVPLLVTALWAAESKKNFWLASAISAASMFAGCCLIVGVIGMRSGTDAVSAGIRLLRESIASVEGLDAMLTETVRQAGLLSRKSSGALTQKEVSEALALILNAEDMVLRLQIPAQISTGSLTAGLLSQVFLRRAANRRGGSYDCPAFRTWRIPKGWGRVLGGTFLAFYLLSIIAPDNARSMFNVVSGLVGQVFLIQGIAAFSWFMQEKGKSVILRRILMALGYLLLAAPFIGIGIADQALDMTKRREKLGDGNEFNPFDPRANPPQ